MNFFKELFKAIVNCFKGFSLLFEKGLWPYLFYPFILWFVIWLGILWLFSSLAIYVSQYVNDQLNINSIPDSGAWLSFAKPFLTGYFSTFISIILRIIFWFISGTFIKYVLLILLSPLFALLSESVEEKLSGKKFPFKPIQFIKDIFRGIAISLRNMFLEYFFIVLCFFITLFVPPLAIITIPVLLLVSWYYSGFTMLDYNFERHRMNIFKSASFTRKHIGTACGIGIVYSFFMMFPFYIGLFIGPVLATVGATLCFLDINNTSPTSDPI